MNQALYYDINSYLSPCHQDWISLLAFLGARYGGDFSRYRKADLEHLIQKLQNGLSMEEITKDMKYYPYYLEAYTAVLGGLVGEYQIQEPGKPDENGHSEPVWAVPIRTEGIQSHCPVFSL